MPDFASPISQLIGSAPRELVDYYQRGDFPVYPDSRINVLPFEAAKNYGRQMQDIPVVKRLGLWVLDDANDSNPFAHISKGPCSGMVIHFSHDSEPKMVFSSLHGFVTAMHEAGTGGLDVDDIKTEAMWVDLNHAIHELAGEGTDDATFLFTAYLPASAALRDETITALARHVDFFVREALAAFFTQYPAVADLTVAQQLAADSHPQVAKQGRAAMAAIQKSHGQQS